VLFRSTCHAVCRGIAPVDKKVGAQASKGPPRHSLRNLLAVLHQSFGAPLDPADHRLWKAATSAFKKEARTVLKYKKYGRKHPALFEVGGFTEEQMIDPNLRAALAEALAQHSKVDAKRKLLESGAITEVLPGSVFSFRVLTEDFCRILMEEIQHFHASKLPARRPNSMNNYGIILNDIGLESLVFALQDAVVQPLSSILLPDEGSELESHHSFTIRYRGGEDTHLDVHTDDSDITFNVNIFGDYTGAPLVFCGINGEPDHRIFKTAYQHKLGYAVLHRGRHRHGAEDITSGERVNLVVWSYSHAYRSSSTSQKVHQRESRKPDTRCVSYTHDRDFGRFREFPAGKKEVQRGRGWCPPRGKEYDGFVPDVPDSEVQRQQQGGQ